MFSASAIKAKEVAAQVARHKGLFFSEKDEQGQIVDYSVAVSGSVAYQHVAPVLIRDTVPATAAQGDCS